MTGGETWIYKRVACPLSALNRIAWLRNQGISTPPAMAHGPSTIAIRRIAGRDGRHLVDPSQPYALIDALQAAIRRLRTLAPTGLELPCWNPAPLIEPRLAARGPLAERGQTIWRRVASWLPRRADALLHGDFHPGQVIFAPDGKLWTIDWDDMAVGHPAVDRLNLVVYLASVSDQHVPPWESSHVQGPRDAKERAIAAALLLRRALKLAERDPHARRPERLMLWAEALLAE